MPNLNINFNCTTILLNIVQIIFTMTTKKWVTATVTPDVHEMKSELKKHTNFSAEVTKLIIKLHKKHIKK